MAAGGGASGSAASIPHVFLGATGLKVSRLCLGTMTFGVGGASARAPGQLNEEEAHALLDRFVAAGGNFIDTANIYSGGESEKILGAWLAKRSREERRKLVISSKVRFPIDASNSNSAGLSRTAILDSVATSLERLHLEYLDILITHAWDDGTPLAETLSTLQDLVRGGKVRYVGVSNVTGWQLQKIVDEGRKLGLPIACLQTQYSLLCRGPVEWELAEVCDREGIALLPWSPLKGGWLSGKITREGGAPEGSRVAFAEKTGVKLQSSPGMELATDRTFDLLDALREIGAKNACSVPQAAIHWLLQQRAVASVVIGAKTLAQLEDNLGAVAATVPKEDHARLTSLSDIPLPYPYEMVFRVQAGRKH